MLENLICNGQNIFNIFIVSPLTREKRCILESIFNDKYMYVHVCLNFDLGFCVQVDISERICDVCSLGIDSTENNGL